MDLKSCRHAVFLATANPSECLTFYRDILGLPLTDDNQYAIVFGLSGAELRISKVPAFTPFPWTVLDWQVSNIEETAASLKAQNVRFERFEGMDLDENDIWTVPGEGVRIAWFKDPDGNVLSVSQRR